MQNEVHEVGTTMFLPGVSAIVTEQAKSEYSKPDATPKSLTTNKGEIKVVPWGENDKFPLELVDKVYKNPTLSSGMKFNINLGFGDGILAVKKSVENGKVVLTPVFDNDEINTFFENNDINGFLLEQLTDMNFFYNVFPEIVLNRDNPKKIVELNHLEAVFSRWSVMDDKTKKIEKHLYCAKFGVESYDKDDVVVTPVLDQKNPLLDLKRRLGLERDINGKFSKTEENRFVIPINFPTPGRYYYQKPYWVSIIESGWYDFAQQIPAFKRALMRNQLSLKYQIELSSDYWNVLYAAEGIKTDEDKAARKAEEINNFQKYCTDVENTGKSLFTYRKFDQVSGKETSYVTIKAIENPFKGGEFLDDLEEVSNITSYAIDVHPSVIGSSPGKNTTINGTEARELFIIKQALLKPIRDRLLLPLYIVKAINQWPKDIYFTIPNLELTTLDKNTGAQKVISQPSLG